MPEKECLTVTVYGGSAGGKIEEGFQLYHQAWEANGRNWNFDRGWAEDVDTMHLASHLGSILFENNMRLITGGTNEGIMGSINRTFADLAISSSGDIRPLGVPLDGYFPELNYHPGLDIVRVTTLPHRLSHFNNGNAFVALRGQHGTHTEITVAIEDERLKDIANYRNLQNGEILHPLRPIIIADQTPRSSRALQIIYGELYPDFVNNPKPNVTDRTYLLQASAFDFNRSHPLTPTIRFSEGGKLSLLAIISGNTQDVVRLRSEGYFLTLREAILGRSVPE